MTNNPGGIRWQDGTPAYNAEVKKMELNAVLQLTEEETDLFENGICLNCKDDDVECNDDCTEHKCLACGYIPEIELKGRKFM